MTKEQSYDLIYIDLKMPGMNGVETLRSLRANLTTAPVYLMTAYYGEFENELRTTQEEGLQFKLMKKPLTSAQLVKITSDILEGAAKY